MLHHLFAVAMGGAGGALCRHAVNMLLPVSPASSLPWPTLCVNVGGSFLAGLLLVLLTQAHPAAVGWRLLLAVGFLGAFTTFSAFSVDTWLMFAAGRWPAAFINVVANVSLSLSACVAGVQLARHWQG